MFGVAVTWIAVFEGYDAPPTAEGVSGATTRTVVTSSLAILALDFVLTALMFTGGNGKMKRSTIDLWVGVFVAAGLAALLFLALKVGNLASFSTAQTYQVQAKFANIGGLKVRAPIKSAGVVVGRVVGRPLRQRELRGDRDVERRRAATSSRATRRPRSSPRVCSASSTSGWRRAATAEMLKDGDRLRLTQSAVVLENLISQFLFNKAAEERQGRQGRKVRRAMTRWAQESR